MQVYFDIGTPAEVFKVLNEEIEKHMEANQNELTGEFACCNFGCAPAASHFALLMSEACQGVVRIWGTHQLMPR